MEQRFLVVRVGEHRVAVPEPSLVEVARAVALTQVPGAAHGLVAGVCNLRGRAAVVLDLRARLGLAPAPPRPGDAMVFVRAHERSVGLLVDRIDDFVTLELDHLVSSRAVSPALGERCRVAETGDGLVVVVDVAAFVTATELDAAEATVPVAAAERAP